MSDDWGDIDGDSVRYPDRLPRRSHSRQGGLARRQRLEITIAVGAALLLIVGIGVGFALGRATAPKPTVQAPVVATQTVEASSAVETTAEATPTPAPMKTIPATPTPPPKDTAKPKTPSQLAPDDGAVLAATTTTVKLRWSRVTDPSGVHYYFEIENRLGGGWGSLQTIGPLAATSYRARVFTSRRRWRVWAVDGAGNKSAVSGWCTYSRKTVPSPSPSKTTT